MYRLKLGMCQSNVHQRWQGVVMQEPLPSI